MDNNRRYSGQPSDYSDEDPEQEPTSAAEYYSEDFEEEDELLEVIQNTERDTLPLPPPYHSPRRGRNEGQGQGRDAQSGQSQSEDAILVFKSTTGPRLTIQPKKVRNNEGPPLRSRVMQTRPITEISVRGNGMQQRGGPRKMVPQPSKPILPQLQRKQIGGGGVIMVGPNNNGKNPNNLAAQKQGTRSGPRKAASLLVVSARGPKQNCRSGRLAIQTSASGSSCRLGNNRKGQTPYNYRIKSNPYTHQPARLPGNKMVEVGGASVVQRVASAKRMAVNDLKNRIAMLLKEAEELRKENRCLKVCQNRQNLALKKWEGRDAQLPRLLQQHRDEIKSMHSQLKKALQQCRDLDDKSKYKDRKIAKMENDLTNLRALATKDNLKERNDLQEQVTILSSNIVGGEKKIRQYMRHVEIMEGNHKHEISTEKQKLIKANQHAMELRHEITGLKIALRDKDRMLNYIQMRTTGRNLLKSFQEKERQHNAKLNPAVLCPDGTVSPRSRSLSPHRNPISGRTYRAQSLDRPADFSQESEILEQPRGESVPNSPRGQVLYPQHPSQNPVEVPDVSIDNPLDQGDHLHQEPQPSDWNENNDNQSIDSIGGGDGLIFQDFSEPVSTFSEAATGPTKNAYYKMSQMLEANNTPINHRPPVVSNAKKARSKPEEKASSPYLATVHHLKGRAVPWAPKKLTNFREPETKKLIQLKPQPKLPQKKLFVPSTGPKTHAEAKQEMKLQRELMESSRKPNMAEVEEDNRQKKKWEKVVHHQMPSGPAPVPQVTKMAPTPNLPIMNTNMSEYSSVQVHPPRQEIPVMVHMQNLPLPNYEYSSSIQVHHSPRRDDFSFSPRPEMLMSPKMTPDFNPLSANSNYLNPPYSNSNPSYNSPRSDLGQQEMSFQSPRNDLLRPPPKQEIPYHHQYIAQSQVVTSGREMGPPRGAFSTPQMQSYPSAQQNQFPQVREIFSIPMVGQQANQPENLPQTQKCIFSYSNVVPHINPHQTNQLNQPMDLPFFSTGDGPQQQGVTEIHPPQLQSTNRHEPPVPVPPQVQRGANQTSTEYQKSQNSLRPATKQRSSINQGTKSAAKQASHIYNPSFFTKLGTWK